MQEPNPYGSELTVTPCAVPGETRSRWSMLLFVAVLLAFGSCGYWLYADCELRLRYPELIDSSPEVDFYWPMVADIEYLILAGVSGLAGMLAFAGAVWGLYYRKPPRK